MNKKHGPVNYLMMVFLCAAPIGARGDGAGHDGPIALQTHPTALEIKERSSDRERHKAQASENGWHALTTDLDTLSVRTLPIGLTALVANEDIPLGRGDHKTASCLLVFPTVRGPAGVPMARTMKKNDYLILRESHSGTKSVFGMSFTYYSQAPNSIPNGSLVEFACDQEHWVGYANVFSTAFTIKVYDPNYNPGR